MNDDSMGATVSNPWNGWAEAPQLVIWDGDCALCARAVDWLAERDRSNRLNFVPYQTCPTPPMTPDLYAASRHAVQLLTSEGEQIAGGAAVIHALGVIGWHPRLIWLARTPLARPVVTLGYRFIARHRDLAALVLFRRR